MPTTDTARSEFGTGKIPDIKLQESILNPEPEPEPKTSAQIIEDQRSKLPKPTGYRLLILPRSLPPKTKGGIYLAQKTIEQEHLAATVGYVVSLGPDAYKDETKFPHGAWCKEGDYILFGRYAGARITMQCDDEGELNFRLLNDDEIIAVIDDPNDYVGMTK